MTIEALKEKRELVLEIIARYTDNTKEAMTLLASESNLEFSNTDSVIAYCQEVLTTKYTLVKKTKLADLQAEAHDNKTFNQITKTWN